MSHVMPPTSMKKPRPRPNPAVWLGLIFSIGGALSYFMYFARFPELRDFPWINLPLVLLGFALSTIGFRRTIKHPLIYRGRISGAFGFVLSLIITVFFNAYIFYFSYQLPASPDAPQVMTPAPDFALTNQRGHLVRLRDYRGKKVVLVFYRGFW